MNPYMYFFTSLISVVLAFFKIIMQNSHVHLFTEALFRCEKILVKMSHLMFRAMSKGVFGY
jgi:hypothetical protein